MFRKLLLSTTKDSLILHPRLTNSGRTPPLLGSVRFSPWPDHGPKNGTSHAKPYSSTCSSTPGYRVYPRRLMNERVKKDGLQKFGIRAGGSSRVESTRGFFPIWPIIIIMSLGGPPTHPAPKRRASDPCSTKGPSDAAERCTSSFEMLWSGQYGTPPGIKEDKGLIKIARHSRPWDSQPGNLYPQILTHRCPVPIPFPATPIARSMLCTTLHQNLDHENISITI